MTKKKLLEAISDKSDDAVIEVRIVKRSGQNTVHRKVLCLTLNTGDDIILLTCRKSVKMQNAYLEKRKGMTSKQPEPDASQADHEQPETVPGDCEQPETVPGDCEQPDASQADHEQPDASQADHEQLDAAQADPEQLDASQADHEQLDASQADHEQLDASQADHEQPDTAQAELDQLVTEAEQAVLNSWKNKHL